jgi:hypothetical protein
MAEEERRQSRRDALLAMHSQAGAPQMKAPEMKAPRDLSQLRPVVQQSVSQQERNARQVFNFAMAGFIATKPEIERQMKGADSELQRLFQRSA